MKKNVLLISSTLLIASALTFSLSPLETESNLLLANAEALARTEIETVYKRDEGKCEVTVGVKGQIKLLGGAILTAGADGKISFDGKVVCGSEGQWSCTPVECKDLYEVILSN